MNDERSVLGIDVILILATAALMTVGILFIYSSGVTSDGVSFSREWIRQIIWVSIGVGILIAVSVVDYARVRDLAPYLYLGAVIILVGTLFIGRVVNGARSWIGIGELGVQPSEFAKIVTIVFLARYLEQRAGRAGELRVFVSAGAIALLPMLLVLAQPDLGTALVYVPVFLVMAWTAGARTSQVMFVILVGLLTIVLTVMPTWATDFRPDDTSLGAALAPTRTMLALGGGFALIAVIGILGLLVMKRRYFGWILYGASIPLVSILGSFAGRRVLPDHALMRLIVFLDPYVDPRGAGWNIIQSVTAVGSGGVSGKGWLDGTQSHLQYLPQQSTDFIFSILAEEWGFLGAVGVFIGFALIVARGLIIASKAKDNFASYVATGVVTMIFFHVFVNVGMAIGVMPITGIPLLFLSYGGSSLWTALIGIGLLMSIYQHRYRY
jgi:rod shape determining protein RodA